MIKRNTVGDKQRRIGRYGFSIFVILVEFRPTSVSTPNAVLFIEIVQTMLSQQLWRSFVTRDKVATNLLKHKKNNIGLSSVITRNRSKSNAELDKELNMPIKYTTSPASNWKASYSRLGSEAEFGPWYEGHIVSASLIIFMIYFFILREENDIDLLLTKPLDETLKEK